MAKYKACKEINIGLKKAKLNKAIHKACKKAKY